MSGVVDDDGMRSKRRTISTPTFAALALAGALGVGFGAQLVSGADSADETVFVPVTPCRLVDTRPGDDNVGPRNTRIGPDESVVFNAHGTGDADSTCDIPTTATAIAANAVAIAPTARGFLTLFPGDVPNPGTANLNFVAGQAPTPNAAVVPLAADGSFTAFNAFGDVHLVIDVNGYYQPSSSIGGVGPAGPAGPEGPVGPAGPTSRQHGRLFVASHLVETTGQVGQYTSMALNAFGNAVISYYDASNTDVRVAICANASCTSATSHRLDDASPRDTSVAIGADGRPVVAYQQTGSARLAICDDPTCITATAQTIGTAGFSAPAVAIGADGNPVVAFSRAGDDRLTVVRCADPTCSSSTSSTPDAISDADEGVAIVIGDDGNPVVAYRDSYRANDTLTIAACADRSCTSATISRPDTKIDTGYEPAIAIGVDGRPVVVSFDNTDGGVRFVACDDAVCSTATTTPIGSGISANIGGAPSVVIGLDDTPVVAYENDVDGVLALAECHDAACSTSTIVDLAPSGTGGGTAIVIGANGAPLVAFADRRGEDLAMATLSMSSWHPTSWGS